MVCRGARDGLQCGCEPVVVGRSVELAQDARPGTAEQRLERRLGLDLGILLGGAILIEAVFNIPGIGRLAFDAIQKSDLPMVQGTVLIGALAIVAMNLVVDVVYAFLDPRGATERRLCIIHIG